MKTKFCTMFTMSRPLSTLLLLLTLLCMVSWSSPAAAQQTDTPKMYAVLEDNGTTLRFKYDTNMPETGGVSPGCIQVSAKLEYQREHKKCDDSDI